ncbi:MAG: metallophosphoesterase family protein [Myxococcales bacterium]|nr:metallophosphoesterase family protein [Myxococcales bacterium]
MHERRERRLVVPESGELTVVVVSDTHGRPHARAWERVRERAPDVILHGGDIGDLAVLDALGELAPEVVAVRGNIDGMDNALPDSVTLRFERGGVEVLSVLLLHVGVDGPRLRAPARRLAVAERCEVVVCGHSHVPVVLRDASGVAVFNPGSCGPRRFALPIVFGVMQLRDGALSFEHVLCETGERWRPGM